MYRSFMSTHRLGQIVLRGGSLLFCHSLISIYSKLAHSYYFILNVSALFCVIVSFTCLFVCLVCCGLTAQPQSETSDAGRWEQFKNDQAKAMRQLEVGKNGIR